jgi:hypothetical protein
MSYLAHRSRQRVARRRGLGDVTDLLSAASNVADDPCLGQVVALLQEIYAAEAGSGTSAPSVGPGIGLCKAVTPLTIVNYAANNTLLVGIMGVAFLGLLVGIGYSLGSD